MLRRINAIEPQADRPWLPDSELPRRGTNGASRAHSEPRPDGPDAGFASAIDELVSLFGADVRRCLRPLAVSEWRRIAAIAAAYCDTLPGRAGARALLARPFADRIFFAGEAAHPFDFTTAHGAHDSGVRAADEAFAALKR